MDCARLGLRALACETALGSVDPSEGVYGMRRALVMAGAQAQVMSLWKVRPTETHAMMVAYYQKLAAGAGRSEAMREVQLEMLASATLGYAHPNRWASFTVAGDWRALDGRPVLPDFARVRPGGHCGACALAGEPTDTPFGWLALLAGVSAVLGRRRLRQHRRIEN